VRLNYGIQVFWQPYIFPNPGIHHLQRGYNVRITRGKRFGIGQDNFIICSKQGTIHPLTLERMSSRRELQKLFQNHKSHLIFCRRIKLVGTFRGGVSLTSKNIIIPLWYFCK
jgi:hypothetical protein